MCLSGKHLASSPTPGTLVLNLGCVLEVPGVLGLVKLWVGSTIWTPVAEASTQGSPGDYSVQWAGEPDPCWSIRQGALCSRSRPVTSHSVVDDILGNEVILALGRSVVQGTGGFHVFPALGLSRNRCSTNVCCMVKMGSRAGGTR